MSTFNFSVCRLVKTVSRAGPQNVMFGNRSASGNDGGLGCTKHTVSLGLSK